mmetsp:Transcript_13632/g.14708  ORF Transcript_13632/g.14708 Transcript_13632/m.14708 type:complete len:105 (-) Transcript_13632:76-390(-)
MAQHIRGGPVLPDRNPVSQCDGSRLRPDGGVDGVVLAVPPPHRGFATIRIRGSGHNGGLWAVHRGLAGDPRAPGSGNREEKNVLGERRLPKVTTECILSRDVID